MDRVLVSLAVLLTLGGCPDPIPAPQTCMGTCEPGEVCSREDVSCACEYFRKEQFVWRCQAAGLDLSAAVDLRGRDLGVSDGGMGD